jgi:hypothetical protein
VAVSHIISVNTSTGTSTSPSCAFGAGYVPQLDDFVRVYMTSTATAITLSATPAAWVNPFGSTVDMETDSHEASVGYHWVTAAEVTAVTTTYTLTGWFAASQTVGIIGTVYRGVDKTNPIDDLRTTQDSGNNASPHFIPGLTGTLSEGSLVDGFVCADGTGTYTDPAGWTLLAKNTAGQQGRAAYRWNTLTTAGTGGGTSSTSVTPSVGDEYIGITLALTAAVVTPSPRNFFQMW